MKKRTFVVVAVTTITYYEDDFEVDAQERLRTVTEDDVFEAARDTQLKYWKSTVITEIE